MKAYFILKIVLASGDELIVEIILLPYISYHWLKLVIRMFLWIVRDGAPGTTLVAKQ